MPKTAPRANFRFGPPFPNHRLHPRRSASAHFQRRRLFSAFVAARRLARLQRRQQPLRQAALGNYQQGWPTKAGETLGGAEQIALADRRAVSFALVECMMKSDFNQGFPAFLRGMLEGQGKLDEMLKGVYNGSREEFLNYTGEWIAAHYGNLQ